MPIIQVWWLHINKPHKLNMSHVSFTKTMHFVLYKHYFTIQLTLVDSLLVNGVNPNSNIYFSNELMITVKFRQIPFS